MNLILLKIYLLTGLVAHKAVWEYLRIRSGSRPVENRTAGISLVKAIKVLILLGIIVQTLLPDVFPVLDEPFYLRVVGTALFTVGLIVAILGRVQLGDNWANIETGQVLEEQQVVSRGLYGYVRHPIYTGDVLLLLGLELALNSWLVLGILFLAPAVFLKAVKEEEMLVRELPGYDSYRARTKRFVPYLI
ncbi:MAG: isoprenylcysteine carboxylmethyltransferase family protein [Acidobacteriota bacterium]|nr:MAG: isoprenylcysteine carboxylmethyltransferase family protein [Acidobacteriota bacterium]